MGLFDENKTKPAEDFTYPDQQATNRNDIPPVDEPKGETVRQAEMVDQDKITVQNYLNEFIDKVKASIPGFTGIGITIAIECRKSNEIQVIEIHQGSGITTGIWSKVLQNSLNQCTNPDNMQASNPVAESLLEKYRDHFHKTGVNKLHPNYKGNDPLPGSGSDNSDTPSIDKLIQALSLISELKSQMNKR